MGVSLKVKPNVFLIMVDQIRGLYRWEAVVCRGKTAFDIEPRIVEGKS